MTNDNEAGSTISPTRGALDVWFAIATANADQCAETFQKWKAQGYKTAALIDGATPPVAGADVVIRVDEYKGYGASVNHLCKILSDAPWVITGGDDTDPDPHKTAQQIAAECTEHFNGTMGVMQPCGDEWHGRQIEQFCGSPWMGREFRERANGGRGPYNPHYFHYHDDVELQHVALKYGCLWQRMDLKHQHNHWSKKGIPRPAHLRKAGSIWAKSKRLLEKRILEGFPGTELK